MLLFLSVATIIGDYGLVGDFGTRFAALNLGVFGYIAYVYLPFLLYPAYCLYKSSRLTFRRLELIVSSALFFIALLILQSLTLSLGSFGNALVGFLKGYIGVFGVWVLDIFFFLFSWLISTERNIESLLKQAKNKLLVAFDFLSFIFSFLFTRTKTYITKSITSIKPYIQNLFASKTQDILDLQRAKQERTTQAQYDFKDVLVDKAFDEMPKAHAAQDLPTQDLSTHTQGLHTQDLSAQEMQTHHAHTPPQTQQNTDSTKPASQHISLEVVPRSQDDLNLEEFLRIQAAKYRDALGNAQRTALSDPAIQPRESLIQTPQHTTPPTDSTASHIPTAHTPKDMPSPIKEITPPPPRPINPDVFLKSKELEQHPTQSEQTLPAQESMTQPQQSKPSQPTKQPHLSHPPHSAPLSQAAQELPPTPTMPHTPLQEPLLPETPTPSVLSKDVLPQPAEMPTPTPPAPTHHEAQAPSHASSPLSLNTQWADSIVQEISSPTPHNTPHNNAPHTQERAPQPFIQPPTFESAEFAQSTKPAQSTQSAESIKPIYEPVFEPTKPAFEYASEYASKPTHIKPPAFEPVEPAKPLYTRVTELAENKALLGSLEYGVVSKPLHFKLPTTSLLNQYLDEKTEIDENEIDRKIEDLLAKLRTFRVEGDVARTYSGPIVTTFEFRPAPGIKVSKILTLEDDLAMALCARSIRIQAPIPGKDVVGIEIPNNSTQTIYLREVLESDLFKTSTSPLTLALGKDIVGNPFITDLKRLPHLLIAGTTGSGKSVGLNAMILSLLYKNSPDNLKLLMIDPKKVEFSIYADIPHLITPIITQPKKAIVGLNSAVAEMDRRYDLMSEMRSKDIDGYNRKAQAEGMESFPYLVIIIDELADLMMTGGKEVEFALARIAQMGRASGIHIIVATQRPSVDVVTGLIKTNLPSRISYKVGSKIDSKVILDTFGAESLLGKGDMLFTPPGVGGVTRLHAPWNTEEEIERVVEFIKSQQAAQYDKNFMLDEKDNLISDGLSTENGENDLITEAKKIILQDKKPTASYLQRRLSIGYNKAANIIEQLEREGFLSAPNAKGTREILGS